jgi:Uma2 family endonuclease
MTAEQFDALPESEGRKWELLDGELIEAPPATPERNLILGRLFFLLYSFVHPRQRGRLLLATDLAVRPNSRLRTDLVFFSSETWRYVEIDRTPVEQPPDMAVAIISPSETATNVNRKVQRFRFLPARGSSATMNSSYPRESRAGASGSPKYSRTLYSTISHQPNSRAIGFEK